MRPPVLRRSRRGGDFGAAPLNNGHGNGEGDFFGGGSGAAPAPAAAPVASGSSNAAAEYTKKMQERLQQKQADSLAKMEETKAAAEAERARMYKERDMSIEARKKNNREGEALAAEKSVSGWEDVMEYIPVPNARKDAKGQSSPTDLPQFRQLLVKLKHKGA